MYFDHVTPYVASNVFLIYYYLEVDVSPCSEVTICSVDGIDLEAKRHRGLRVHASKHGIVGPSTGNCFSRGITVLLGEQLIEGCGAMLSLRWYRLRDVLDVE